MTRLEILIQEGERLGVCRPLAFARAAKAKGFVSLAQLAKCSDEELLRYSQIGVKTLAIFRQVFNGDRR